MEIGRAADVVPQVQPLVHEQPLREGFWAILVLALFRAGRQAEALATYGRARDVLVDELGIEPGEELQALHARVLAQDPTLLRTAAAPAVPESLRLPSGEFVGRVGEIERLRRCWQRAVAGDAVTVAVRGMPGSGRRRLVTELAVEVADGGFPVGHSEGGWPPAHGEEPRLTG